MTQASLVKQETAEAGDRTETGSPDLSSQDSEALHGDDRAAGTAVAGIMIAIFTLAVVGYTIIALLAAAGPS
jgi:hypothetical protein